MKYADGLMPRILRDIDDAVLALDQHGQIIYVNPQCRRLLGLGDSALGKTYAEVFFDEKDNGNDAFHQFVLDAVYDKKQTHSGLVAHILYNKLVNQ